MTVVSGTHTELFRTFVKPEDVLNPASNAFRDLLADSISDAALFRVYCGYIRRQAYQKYARNHGRNIKANTRSYLLVAGRNGFTCMLNDKSFTSSIAVR